MAIPKVPLTPPWIGAILVEDCPMATTTLDPTRPSIPLRWIRSPGWDLVWILNALWLGPLILLLAWDHDNVRASPASSRS